METKKKKKKYKWTYLQDKSTVTDVENKYINLLYT